MLFDYNSVPKSAIQPMSGAAYATVNGCKHTYLCARNISDNNIPGVIVECGVANGAQVGIMAHAMGNPPSRSFHLFDSFAGIPMAGPYDDEQPGIGRPTHDVSAPIRDRLVSSGVSVGALRQVQNNLSAWQCNGHFIYHEGWFQDTLPRLSDFPPIALLRLDGDLYESTMVCLRYLYPLVVTGGIVIIDDYALAGCRKAVHEYLNDAQITVEMSAEDVGGGSIIASWIV